MAICSKGRIHAKAIIVATHFPFLNKHGSYFLKLYQQRSYVLALSGVEAPKGMFIGDTENSYSFRMAEGLLLLGGGGHRTGKPGGNWDSPAKKCGQVVPQRPGRIRLVCPRLYLAGWTPLCRPLFTENS